MTAAREGGRLLDGGGGPADPLRIGLEENREILYRFLLRLSGDRERARDLAQEAMVRAILGYPSFRGASSFRTWLLAIAANLYRDQGRRSRTLPLGEVPEPDDGGRSAEGDLRTLDAALAMRAMAALPPKKRAALALRIEFDYTYEEIAAILGCPIGTVRSRIHHALAAIRRALGVEDGR